MLTFAFPRVCVRIMQDEQLVETEFDDGSICVAAPNYDPDSIAMAWRLGYEGDTVAMTMHHDAAHQFLAAESGLEYCAVIWDVAHRRHTLRPSQAAFIEAMVLKNQRELCHRYGID